MEKKKNKAGRKHKLTPEVQEKICQYIEAGNYAKVACVAAGVSESTFYEWIQRGKQAIEKKRHNKFSVFSESIALSFAKSEVRNVAILSKAGMSGEWRASLEWLARRANERWGTKDHITQDIKLTNTDIVRKWVNEDGSEPKDIKNRKKSVQKTKPADVSVSGKDIS